MQITKAESYGLLGVIYLAGQEDGRRVPLSEIAESQDVPEKFLAKIFQYLTKTGIVKSHRGVKGGFTLARNPKELTFRDVLEAIQGPYHLIMCIPDRKNCQKSDGCPIRVVMQTAEESLMKVFEKYTIGDMLNGKKGNRWPSIIK